MEIGLRKIAYYDFPAFKPAAISPPNLLFDALISYLAVKLTAQKTGNKAQTILAFFHNVQRHVLGYCLPTACEATQNISHSPWYIIILLRVRLHTTI